MKFTIFLSFFTLISVAAFGQSQTMSTLSTVNEIETALSDCFKVNKEKKNFSCAAVDSIKCPSFIEYAMRADDVDLAFHELINSAQTDAYLQSAGHRWLNYIQKNCTEAGRKVILYRMTQVLSVFK